ncbi:hypothetical protein MRX96_002575 [Rhipicephalus microplus]
MTRCSGTFRLQRFSFEVRHFLALLGTGVDSCDERTNGAALACLQDNDVDTSQLVSEPAAGGGGHEVDLELINDVSVSKEEMERYMKISRDLKLRRGSLMPPGGTSGTKVTTTPIALCSGLKKKPNLTMETRVELYGKGRVKLSFDGVSEEAHSPQQQPPLHQDDSATSLVRRGGPSTGITPRRLSLEERAPPPTPAPSLASVHKRNKSMDFGTIPLKDDDHPEPSNPV